MNTSYTAIAIRAVAFAAIASVISACNFTGEAPLPPNISNPSHAKTAEGARMAYVAALVGLRDVVGDSGYVLTTGLLTDELQTIELGLRPGGFLSSDPDARLLPEIEQTHVSINRLYRQMQRTRGQADQARGLLRDFYPNGNSPLIGHMLAVNGYTELMFAEAFCSGIPLSTLDYDGDYTYRAGSTTDEVLMHAVALFDSSIAMSTDSARVLNLARVGKGRALLQLGRFHDAELAVADVPPDFQYDLMFSPGASVWGLIPRVPTSKLSFAAMGDREGNNGLPFITQHDGRLPDTLGWTFEGAHIVSPSIQGDHVIRIASGLEARLIRAEATLKGGESSWLSILNDLRSESSIPGLDPLLDPVSEADRVDLLFRERAYWLYLTGHRQGDLRRLIKQYGRTNPETLYPTGPYAGNLLTYGIHITLPIPLEERRLNPLFHGCINRGA